MSSYGLQPMRRSVRTRFGATEHRGDEPKPTTVQPAGPRWKTIVDGPALGEKSNAAA